MSMPQDQQQPPPVTMTQGSYSTHSGHGSIGPLIAVLAVIIILGMLAVVIGRLCSGSWRLMDHGQFDIETWVEHKCSTCIDGRINPPLPSTNIAGSIKTHQEIKQERSIQDPPGTCKG
ncbi:hypothetical protein L1049_026767 [Liquidambar formosana]|uniref:Uncharacterized protein n=1 Tax=Liquidambar formosana TaxID=63359 RepID=A0AAP0NEB2_LIQFO